jgi:hypothetical protein
MRYLLTFTANRVTVRTGYECEWMAERARIRALANGATFATIAAQVIPAAQRIAA